MFHSEIIKCQTRILNMFLISIILRTTRVIQKYVAFYHNFFSHITLGFDTHIWTTNSVDLKEKFLNLT